MCLHIYTYMLTNKICFKKCNILLKNKSNFDVYISLLQKYTLFQFVLLNRVNALIFCVESIGLLQYNNAKPNIYTNFGIILSTDITNRVTLSSYRKQLYNNYLKHFMYRFQEYCFESIILISFATTCNKHVCTLIYLLTTFISWLNVFNLLLASRAIDYAIFLAIFDVIYTSCDASLHDLTLQKFINSWGRTRAGHKGRFWICLSALAGSIILAII